MSTTCVRCNATLSPEADRCGRCGAAAMSSSATIAQYGLLDLDTPVEDGPSLDVDVPRPQRKPVRRAESGPVGGQTRTPGGNATAKRAGSAGAATSRTLSAGAAPSATSRTASGAGAAARSNATLTGQRAQSAPLGAQSQPRSNATLAGQRAQSASVAGQQPARTGATMAAQRAAFAEAEAEKQAEKQAAKEAAAELYSTGVILGGDPLGEGFDADAPALDIDEDADPRRRKAEDEDEDEEEKPRELTDAEKRHLAIQELAGYGPKPKKPWEAPAYWIRVTLRKRELDQQLSALAAQRKRADDTAREARAKLGEGLYRGRRDPRLASLARQIEAVSTAEQALGSAEQSSTQQKQSISKEQAELDREVRDAEALAAPLRKREAEIEAEIGDAKERAKRVDMRRRKLEQDLEALQKRGGDPEQVLALRAERDALHGEVQTIGITVRPLEDELSEVRRELAIYLRTLATLQQEQQAAAEQLERAQQKARLSTGTAQNARRDALIALAQAAVEIGLASLLPNDLKAVQEAVERADKRRSEEELLRAAVRSFDEDAYKLGMGVLVGSSGMALLALAIAIIF